MTASLNRQVSVVLPVYNGERFLSAAVDSILTQTFQDFEFVIVDDGSNDRSSEILSGYQETDSRIVVCRHQQNLGITATLNDGCRVAKGEFLAIMNQDDVSLP